jgi:hypothetical protein
MAKIEPMVFTGRIGPTIHYKMGNGYYVRSMPRKFKQTKATKARATEFGMASTIGSAIRRSLSSVIPDTADRRMHGRLVGAVFAWLQSFNGSTTKRKNAGEMANFQFKEKVREINSRWKPRLQIKNLSAGECQIYIPSFIPSLSVSAPSGTRTVVCKIAMGSVEIKSGRQMGTFNTEFNVEYSDIRMEEQTISVRMPTRKDCLLITGMSLTYMILKNGNLIENSNKAFMPAGIVNAFTL